MEKINKILEKVKTAAFLDKNAAFLAPLLCQLNFIWNEKIPTAQTNGINIEINPKFLMSLPDEARATLLLHELWHIARLHLVRRGNREPELWNIVCDAIINRDLKKDGYSFNKMDAVFIKTDKSEEELYEEMLPNWKSPKDYVGDLRDGEEVSSNMASDVVNAVSNALQTAKLCGYSSGEIEGLISDLLRPKLNWRNILEKFFQDLVKEDFSWKRPNKRYQDIYLPSLYEEEGKLSHIMFFLDTSGSMSEEQFKVFLTELYYLKKEYSPEKLTIVQFDTGIKSIVQYEKDTDLKQIKTYGRGGTSYRKVADLIDKEKPICAVIFTDLYAEPMRKIKADTEVFWVISDSREIPPYGRYCYV